MNNSHFSLKLRKDRPKKDGTVSIYLYANINGKLKWYSTNRSVNEKNWNSTKKIVIGDEPKKFEINNHVKNYTIKAEKYVQQCNIDDELASTDKLDRILRSPLFTTNSYYDFVENYIKEFKSNYSHGTIQVFKTHLNKIKRFKPEIDITAIDKIFWHKFEAFLAKDDNKTNTINKQFRVLRKFLNKAVEHDIIRENPLKDIKVKRQSGNREFLSISEIKKLQKIYDDDQLTLRGHKNVLRYFLFACYTSLRYQDVKLLKHKNIDNGFITIQVHKTKKPLNIPLSKKALLLVEAETIQSKNVFRVFENQVTNRHLKEIMKFARINKHISFHCARHTWAMITLELTENIALVSDILGHSDIRITQIYAKIQEKAKRDAMMKWDEF